MTIELSQERRDELRKLIATDAQVDGVRKFALDAPIGEGPFIAILAVITRMEMAEDDIARQADALARAIAERDEARNAAVESSEICGAATIRVGSIIAERDAAIARADAAEEEAADAKEALTISYLEGARQSRNEAIAALAQRDAMRRALGLFTENVDAPPDSNCSCHISPPCNDCVDNSGLREAFEAARQALATIGENHVNVRHL